MVLVVQVRSSVMCTPRNLVLLTLSTVELSMVSGGWSMEFLLKSITTSFVFSTLVWQKTISVAELSSPQIEGQIVSATPFSQLCHFLSVMRFIVVADETYHCCVISELDDVVGAELGSAVVGQQREEQQAEHTAL